MSERAIGLMREAVGDEHVLVGDPALEPFLEDWWVMSILRHRERRAARPAAVVRPGRAAEVAAVLRIADEGRIAVVASGARSGVCGGAVAPSGAIVVDLSRMDRILALDETGLVVTTEPGVRGGVFEAWLRERGYTMGHFPQSIDISSVGGWISTRASGQLSTLYGNVEDMLLAFEAVLADGTIVRTRPVPRAAAGPSLRSLFLGGEGALGIVTEATFRVHPVPEAEARASASFPDFHAGLEAIREVVRVGWRPAVVRLYDGIEAGRNFAGVAPADHSLLLFHSEGPRALVDAELPAVVAIATARGGSERGAKPVDDWFGHRNRVPHLSTFLDRGMIVDTIEVAVGWDRIHDLYDEVTRRMRAVEGMVVVSGHSSHSYTQGTNIYFTFAAQPPDMSEAEPVYFAAWTAAMEATLAVGGTISHHHGVGRLRTRWMREELGSAHELLVRLKNAFDPHGILNPGVLVES